MIISVKKAFDTDFNGRFREIIMDPLNILINRVSSSGTINNNNVVLHNGIEVPYQGKYAYYGNFSNILVYNRGVHEPLEEFIFQELLKKMPETPFMIELGAYWGHYSMWLKKYKPLSTVILIEPNKHNLLVGKSNFNRLNLDGNFIQKKVGHQNFSVDDFIKQKKLKKLNILHSDIQGYELEMLEDSKKSLSLCVIDYLMISTHSQSLHYEIINYLKLFNYDIEVSSDFDNETTSFDGFILASSPKVEKIINNWKPLGRLEILNSSPLDIYNYIMNTKKDFNI